jgi:hypothetical protein
MGGCFHGLGFAIAWGHRRLGFAIAGATGELGFAIAFGRTAPL